MPKKKPATVDEYIDAAPEEAQEKLRKFFDTNFRLLDLTPYGRQETWEDSPEGWPQTPPYQWWRLHDEYEN